MFNISMMKEKEFQEHNATKEEYEESSYYLGTSKFQNFIILLVCVCVLINNYMFKCYQNQSSIKTLMDTPSFSKFKIFLGD